MTRGERRNVPVSSGKNWREKEKGRERRCTLIAPEMQNGCKERNGV